MRRLQDSSALHIVNEKDVDRVHETYSIYSAVAFDTAINRGHNRVTAADIEFAEFGYSNEMLANTQAEIVDTNPDLDGVLGAFQGSPIPCNPTKLRTTLSYTERFPRDRGSIGAIDSRLVRLFRC